VPAYFKRKSTLGTIKSIAYNRENLAGDRFSWIEIPVLGTLWGLWRVDSWVRSFQLDSVPTGLFFCLNDDNLLCHFAPFNLYETYRRGEIRIQSNELANLGDRSGQRNTLSALIGGSPGRCFGLWIISCSRLVDLGMGTAGRRTGVFQAIFPAVIVPLFNRPAFRKSLNHILSLAKDEFQALGFHDGRIQKVDLNAFLRVEISANYTV
jgi:hypothetical protein